MCVSESVVRRKPDPKSESSVISNPRKLSESAEISNPCKLSVSTNVLMEGRYNNGNYTSLIIEKYIEGAGMTRFEEIKAMIPRLPQGTPVIYLGQFYEMRGKDLVYMPSLKPFQDSIKSDYYSFMSAVQDPINTPERLEFNRTLIKLNQTILIFKRILKHGK